MIPNPSIPKLPLNDTTKTALAEAWRDNTFVVIETNGAPEGLQHLNGVLSRTKGIGTATRGSSGPMDYQNHVRIVHLINPAVVDELAQKHTLPRRAIEAHLKVTAENKLHRVLEDTDLHGQIEIHIQEPIEWQLHNAGTVRAETIVVSEVDTAETKTYLVACSPLGGSEGQFH